MTFLSLLQRLQQHKQKVHMLSQEMPTIPYQSGLSQKALLSPSGWPRDECQYKSRKKPKKLTNRIKLTHLLSLFVQNCLHLCPRWELGKQWKTATTITLLDLKIPKSRKHQQKSPSTVSEYNRTPKQVQCLHGMVKIRKKHWKSITEVMWLANIDNDCSLNQPACRTKLECHRAF